MFIPQGDILFVILSVFPSVRESKSCLIMSKIRLLTMASATTGDPMSPTNPRPLTFLCLADEFKGETFLIAAKEAGCRVLLLTKEACKDEPWPRNHLDEVFLMPRPSQPPSGTSQQPDLIPAVSYLARSRVIDRIIPLDDFDVQAAAELREHLRLPGMNASAARHFRDKLAMRVEARALGLPVPEFTGVFNYGRLRDFMARLSPPWMFKPRFEAGSVGIKKLTGAESVWRQLAALGDAQSFYLLEQFLPGAVFHVDSLVAQGEVVFACASRYAQPPFNVAHGGGVFRTQTLPPDSADARTMLALNGRLLPGLGLVQGAAHTEFIKAEADGQFYLLETAARVGGVNIADMIEAATGVNLWREWLKIELAEARGETYAPPTSKADHAGLIICLARQEHPDLSPFDAPEVVWRLPRAYHARLILASPDPERLNALLDDYAWRFGSDFLAVAPQIETHF